MRAVLITISLTLAAVLFGSLIPQGLPPELYMQRFGQSFGVLFLQLGLDDIFRTKGFLLLGLILFAQLLICTGKRISMLRSGMKIWAAGSVLLHVGLLVFLISTGASLWWGQTLLIEAPEGKIISLTTQGFPFDVRLERFAIDYYPETRAVRQYRSDVSLFQNGKEISRGSLEVNEPLKFERTKIFQMSYGWLLEGSVRVLPDGKAVPFSAENGAWIDWIGAEKERLRIVLIADPDKSPAMRPEAGFLLLNASGGQRTASAVIGSSAVTGNVELRFENLRRYSGLQVKHDPAVYGIFGGLLLALAGLVLRYVPLERRNAI